VLAIVLAILALSNVGIALTLLVFLFAIALLFLGFQRLSRALAASPQSESHRAFDGVVGVVSIVASIVVLVAPGVGLLSLVLLLYLALLILGIGWLWFAFVPSGAPGWYRGFAAALGMISLVAAFVALVDIRAAILTLVLVLAFVLLVLGIGDLVTGWTGRPYRSFLHLPISPFPPSGAFGPPPERPPPPAT
jgi:uncharacterized membrane protein HdeD (DUF308 family)